MKSSTQSLSRRLSWGLVLSLIVILAVQWLVVSVAIRHLIENQMASRLIQDGESLLAGLHFDDDGVFHIDPKRVNTIYQRPFSGHYYVISVGLQRQVSRSLWDEDLLIPKINAGIDVRLTQDGPQRQTLLSVTHGYQKQGYLINILVAEDMAPFRAELRRFQWLYGLASGAILLVLLLVQSLIVRRALSPLKALSANLARLERGEVDRIVVGVPSEIAPTIAELNRLLATMGKKTRRSRESLGNLAHALKTQLAVLTQVGREPEIETLPTVKQALENAVEAMRVIVERELKRARLIGDMLPGRRVHLRDEVSMLVQTLQLMYVDKPLQIEWQVAAGAQFYGDQEDLLELLGNLLDNACKWARARVRLTVQTGDDVLFTIEDDGPGCAPDLMQQLTQRGFRADESKPGSGLGLAIVRDIVESYGGALEITRSETLGGLSVAVRLPGR